MIIISGRSVRGVLRDIDRCVIEVLQQLLSLPLIVVWYGNLIEHLWGDTLLLISWTSAVTRVLQECERGVKGDLQKYY